MSQKETRYVVPCYERKTIPGNKIYLVRDLISLLNLLQIYNKIYLVRDSISLIYLLQIYSKIYVVRDSISLFIFITDI